MSAVRLVAMLAVVGCDSTYDPPERSFGNFGQSADGDTPLAENGNSSEDVVGGPNDDPDGDGYTNAEEVGAGTNPNYEYSHPYTGDYRVGFCGTKPNPTGPTKSQTYASDDGFRYDYLSYQQGDVADNFTMRDQYGEEVDLYSFCGKHIMLVVGAGWCGPCQQEAAQLQSIAEAYPEAQILQVLSQDSSYDHPSQGFIESWASQFGFQNVAALGSLSAPTTYDEYFSAPASIFEDDGYIPTIYHLDETMKVLSADRGIQSPDTWL